MRLISMGISGVIGWLVLAMAGAAVAQSAPCGRFPGNTTELQCTCSGSESGSVWGSGPYTSDSAICVAARHAGVIGAQGGEVRVLARPGQDSYPGSIANGVQSSNWGRYGSSFDIVPVMAAVAPCGRYPVGQGSYACSCSGTEGGSVWGSGPYTADSAICVAARHAGAIGTGGGTVSLVARPGQDSYPGSIANGVQTSNWGRYGNSFDFVSAGSVPASTSAVAACGRYPGGAGPLVCACTGSETGSVWGSGPYTSDSNLCAAARHAGVIGPGGGTITVLGIGGLSAYSGSEAHGVRTSNWGGYGESVIFNRN